MKKQVSVVVFLLFFFTASVAFGQYVTVEVEKGDTISGIAQRVGSSTFRIMQLNELDSSLIHPGQKLKVLPYSNDKEVTVSWYGPKFHGNNMANGREFNMYDESVVAHKWLPFGTKVKLTYKDKSIVVRVQDRGPYVEGREFDLSKGAAEKLGMLAAGVVNCKVEIL